jgi:rhodanese-related sulfurtransferase
MPSAPIAEIAELAKHSSAHELAAGDQSGHGHPVLHVVPAPTAVPLADVSVPPAPTARIHWVGNYVYDRHPAELYADIVSGAPGLVVVDARWPEAFAREHLPTAINLPFKEITESGTAHLSREALYVVYCWNASCHASTKVAERLDSLGFRVKELHGGLQDWKKQGFPTERS